MIVHQCLSGDYAFRLLVRLRYITSHARQPRPSLSWLGRYFPCVIAFNISAPKRAFTLKAITLLCKSSGLSGHARLAQTHFLICLGGAHVNKRKDESGLRDCIYILPQILHGHTPGKTCLNRYTKMQAHTDCHRLAWFYVSKPLTQYKKSSTVTYNPGLSGYVHTPGRLQPSLHNLHNLTVPYTPVTPASSFNITSFKCAESDHFQQLCCAPCLA